MARGVTFIWLLCVIRSTISVSDSIGNKCLILHNGNIFTSDEDQYFVESIYIRDNLIVDRGTNEYILDRYREQCIDQVFDLQQKTVLPGLNDAHVHVYAKLENSIQLNDGSFIPDSGPTVSDVIQMIRKYVTDTNTADAEHAHQPNDDDEKDDTSDNTLLMVLVGDGFRDEIMFNTSSAFYGQSVRDILGASVSPNNPIFIIQWSFHLGWVNDCYFDQILEAMVLKHNENKSDDDSDHDKKSKTEMERELCTNKEKYFGRNFMCNASALFTGQIEEYSLWKLALHYNEYVRHITEDEVRHTYLAYQKKAIRAGFTSLQNMAIFINHRKTNTVLKQMESDHELLMRWRTIAFALDLNVDEFVQLSGWDSETARKTTAQESDASMHRAFGIKYVLDGSPIEDNAALEEAYSHRPDWFGRLNVDAITDILYECIRLNHTDGTHQLLLHMVGDKSAAVALHGIRDMCVKFAVAEAVAEANADANVNAAADVGSELYASFYAQCTQFWRQSRTRVEHGEFVYKHLDTMRRFGLILVQNPTHFSVVGLMEDRWGDRGGTLKLKRSLEYIQPMRSVLEHGISLAMGSDNDLINPWFDVYFSLVHPTTQGREAIDIFQTIVAYTHGSAFAEFMEHKKGLIKKGYLADIIIVNQNIFAIADPNYVEMPFELLFETKSILTMVNGNIVYVDENEIESQSLRRKTDL